MCRRKSNYRVNHLSIIKMDAFIEYIEQLLRSGTLLWICLTNPSSSICICYKWITKMTGNEQDFFEIFFRATGTDPVDRVTRFSSVFSAFICIRLIVYFRLESCVNSIRYFSSPSPLQGCELIFLSTAFFTRLISAIIITDLHSSLIILVPKCKPTCQFVRFNSIRFKLTRYNTASNYERYHQDYIRLYVDVMSVIVKREDPSRPFVVSSPSNGKFSEQEDYSANNPQSQLYGDGTIPFYYKKNMIVWFQLKQRLPTN